MVSIINGVGLTQEVNSVKPTETAPKAFSEPETKSETTTANTDAVDSEIKQLKEKQRLLQRQLRGADGTTAAELQRQLEQISQELAMKDNDAYRRANTLFT